MITAIHFGAVVLIVLTVLIAVMLRHERKTPNRTAKVVEQDIEKTTRMIELLSTHRIRLVLPQDARTIASTDKEIKRQQQLRLALYDEIKALHWLNMDFYTHTQIAIIDKASIQGLVKHSQPSAKNTYIGGIHLRQ